MIVSSKCFFDGAGAYRLRRGDMDKLIEQLASKAGIDAIVAEKTAGIMLGFLRSEGPSDQVQMLIDRIPGAEAAIAASRIGDAFAALIGNGIMAAGTRLMSLGLGIVEIQDIARELLSFSRERVGADQIGQIVAGTPGLSQFT
jgi:hypothetical protein